MISEPRLCYPPVFRFRVLGGLALLFSLFLVAFIALPGGDRLLRFLFPILRERFPHIVTLLNAALRIPADKAGVSFWLNQRAFTAAGLFLCGHRGFFFLTIRQ